MQGRLFSDMSGSLIHVSHKLRHAALFAASKSGPGTVLARPRPMSHIKARLMITFNERWGIAYGVHKFGNKPHVFRSIRCRVGAVTYPPDSPIDSGRTLSVDSECQGGRTPQTEAGAPADREGSSHYQNVRQCLPVHTRNLLGSVAICRTNPKTWTAAGIRRWAGQTGKGCASLEVYNRTQTPFFPLGAHPGTRRSAGCCAEDGEKPSADRRSQRNSTGDTLSRAMDIPTRLLERPWTRI